MSFTVCSPKQCYACVLLCWGQSVKPSDTMIELVVSHCEVLCIEREETPHSAMLFRGKGKPGTRVATQS